VREEPLHQRAVAALLTAGQRDLSLVDCVSFEIIRALGIEAELAFDHHFVQQGFRRI
jgi:predicted nucleic acid-binding protein